MVSSIDIYIYIQPAVSSSSVRYYYFYLLVDDALIAFISSIEENKSVSTWTYKKLKTLVRIQQEQTLPLFLFFPAFIFHLPNVPTQDFL